MKARGQGAMKKGGDGLSIIVPVYNEEGRIRETAGALLRGLPREAEIVFVCNGCTDRSLEILMDIAGQRARILNLPVPSKAAAIRAAEQHVAQFPRFYVDSDVVIEGSGIAALAVRLRTEDLEMISPRVEPDLRHASWAAKAVHGIWHALPHGAHGAFHGVIGVSAQARSRWGEMPDVIADDSFIEAQVPPSRRLVDQVISQTTRPPRTLSSSVRVRQRWAMGQRELRSRGVAVAKTPGQRRALLRLLFSWSHSAATLLYIGVRIYAEFLAVIAGTRYRRWYQDQTTRRPDN